MLDPEEEAVILDEVKKYFSQKDFEPCEEKIKLIFKINDRNYEAHYLYARVLLEKKNYKEAKNSLKKCIEINPNKIDAYKLIIKISDYQGNHKSIEKYLNILQKIYPEGNDYLKMRAKYYLKMRKYAEAEACYSKLLNLESFPMRQIKYQLRLAGCLFLQQKYEEALKVLSPLEEKKIQNLSLYYLLSKIHLAAFHMASAQSIIESSLLIYNENDEFKLMDIYYDYVMEKYYSAIEKAKVFLKDKANDVKNYKTEKLSLALNRVIFVLAASYMEVSQYQNFKFFIEKYNLNDEINEYFLVMARYFYKIRDFDNCNEYLNKMIEKYPNYAQGICFKIHLLKSRGEIDEAKELSEKNVKIIEELYKNVKLYFKPNDNPLSIFSLAYNSLPENIDVNKEKSEPNKVEENMMSDNILKNPNLKYIVKGFCGDVYEEIIDGEKFAVKYYNLEETIKNQIPEMLNLKHENLISYEGFTNKKIIMEYARGGCLKTLLNNIEVKLPMKFKISIMLNVARALIFLHGKGIIHGDIRADNVLLDSPFKEDSAEMPIAKVSNYGLCSTLPNREGYGKSYAKNKNFYVYDSLNGLITTKNDVYSYGLFVYEIFTRKVPYEDLSEKEFNEKKKKNSLPKMELGKDKGVKDVEKLIKKCCEGDPKKRPDMSTVLELIQKIKI